MKTLYFLLAILFFTGFGKALKGSEEKISERNVLPDTALYPKADSNYIVKLLVPGKFKLNEINYDANTMEWYGLVSNGVGYSIEKFQPEHIKMMDQNGGEIHSIKGHDSLNTILLMSGVELLEKDVNKMQIGRTTLGAGDRLELNYNGKKVVFTVDGEIKKDKATKKQYISNYKLYIAPLKKEKSKTLLLQHKRVDDVFPEFVFMGDMDNDKFPDLIINNKIKREENHYVLYLSHNSPKGFMYRVMGMFNFTE